MFIFSLRHRRRPRSPRRRRPLTPCLYDRTLSRAFPFTFHFRLNGDRPFLPMLSSFFFAVTLSTIASLTPEDHFFYGSGNEVEEDVVRVSRKYIKCYAHERFSFKFVYYMNE